MKRLPLSRIVVAMRLTVRLLCTIFCPLLVATPGTAGDWPAWRYDAGHTAAAPEAAPDNLRLEWTRMLTPRQTVWDDPLNQDMMQYDRVFEPIAKDGLLYVGFNDADKLVAYDLTDGTERWAFYTDGPVRFPAVAYREGDQGVVLFVSDDGTLYSVGQQDGKLRWKFQGAPSNRKAVGNQRVISSWPARGGPVVVEDHVYFAASIWPFMGTYIYCLDAKTHQVVWLNDSTSSQYIKQPHSAPSFAGVAPQGTMTVSGDMLLVPGGRSVPAAFDRNTGELRHFLFNEGGKGNGGSLVLARGDEFYVHTRHRGVRAYDLVSGNKTAFRTNEPVLTESVIYAAETKPTLDANGKVIKLSEDEELAQAPVGTALLRAYSTDKKVIWELENVDGRGDLIKAGNRLYAAGGGKLTVLELPADGSAAKPILSIDVPGDVKRLLTADNKLIAVTAEGQIHCFGASESRQPLELAREVAPRPYADPMPLVKQTLSEIDPHSPGYLLYFGAADERLLDQLLTNCQLDIVVVDEDADRVDRLRRLYDAAGVYGSRINLHVGNIESFDAPPFIATLVLLVGETANETVNSPAALRRAYESVRPYGGCLAVIPSGDLPVAQTAKLVARAELEKADIKQQPLVTLAQRVGALTGAADWTHQYGNVANTIKSDDSRVKLPLGILWFGGSSNLDVLPRHGHGPPEQVIGGRLFVEGMNSLSCRDVYTGRVLWKRTFDDLGTFGIYFDETYEDTPLNPQYNQVHIPGANGRGTNFVATEDAVYIVEGNACHVLSIQTGETVRKLQLPRKSDSDEQEWAYIGVYKDVLLGGAGFAKYQKSRGVSLADLDSKLTRNSAGFGSKSLDAAACETLVAFDRNTGDVLWQLDARHSFIHNGIVAGDGKVFCLDKMPQVIEDQLRRRGQDSPETYRIVAVDYRTGQPVWEQTDKIFGTWLGYSEARHLLLHAGASASDRLKSEVGQGMAVYRGENGEQVWRVNDRKYTGPCILHNDTILTNANSYEFSSGAYSLLTGAPQLIKNPLTQEEQPWQLCRTYGCNTIVASENLLTFRSGAAGFYDLETMSGTGNFGGFKSGCTSNLIVANGVLNAPDYTRTCTCGYQNQTSLALVHAPDMDMWTVNHVAQLSKPGDDIKRIGLNLGAPGDRVAPDGTLWIDYPAVGGDSVALDVQLEGQPQYYSRNSLAFSGPSIPWIGSSGIENVTRITVPLAVKGVADAHEYRIQDGADDVEEREDGSIYIDSSDLELVQDDTTQVLGLRFPGIDLPRGKPIEAAYVQFTTDETGDEKTELRVQVQDTDNAPPFADVAKNVSSRTGLGEPLAWAVAAWGKEGEASDKQQTPDLTRALQQIINRESWQPGNAVAITIQGAGKRVAESFEGDAAKAPSLVIRTAHESPAVAPMAHLVRLYFAEPANECQVGERIFDVCIGDEIVEHDLDVVQAAGGVHKTIVREYNVRLTDQLTVQFVPKVGHPVLSGIEIIRQ